MHLESQRTQRRKRSYVSDPNLFARLKKICSVIREENNSECTQIVADKITVYSTIRMFHSGTVQIFWREKRLLLRDKRNTIHGFGDDVFLDLDEVGVCPRHSEKCEGIATTHERQKHDGPIVAVG